EEAIDAGRFSDLGVGFLVARIALEVLSGTELGRVHEDRGDDDIVLAAGRFEERDVAGMERAHRGHEPDTLARERGAQLVDSAERLHDVLAPSSEASVSASAR